MVKMAVFKQTIIVPSEGFVNWGGGIDYIRGLLIFLVKINRDNPSIKIVLLVPFLPFYHKLIRSLKDFIKFLLRRPKYKMKFNTYENFKSDAEMSNYVEIYKYVPGRKKGRCSIQQYIRNSHNPIVFPIMKPFLASIIKKSLLYIRWVYLTAVMIGMP